MGDLVDDGAADLVVDLLLGTADCADRLPVDSDPVGQDSRVLRCAAGERDTLAKPEQAGRSGANVLALGTYGLVKHRCSGTARDP